MIPGLGGEFMGIDDRYFVAWDDRYRVGVQAIDQQHRFLILKIRELQEAMVAGNTGALLAPLIHNLLTYTHFHFAYEERLYAERGYGDIRSHLDLHAGLVRQVTELGDALKNDRLRVGAPVMTLLQHWLVDHILGDDMVAFGVKTAAKE